MYQFTVEGSGVFPFDMLRYDGCYPKDSLSASNLSTPLEFSEAGIKRDLKKTRRVVLLCRHRPTIARWEPYRWAVSDVRKISGSSRAMGQR
jgi:hypothetical protein